MFPGIDTPDLNPHARTSSRPNKRARLACFSLRLTCSVHPRVHRPVSIAMTQTQINSPPSSESSRLGRLESILNEAERRALVAVLRSRPDLPLDKLQDCFSGRYGATLRTITVRELLETEIDIELPEDGGPMIDRSALEQAKRLNGPAFDAHVLRAICSAGGEPVSASYLRARVGGPRWKLQGSLRRLVDAGEVERDGVTSSTRYRPLRS